jgi:hypothetical protein
MEGIPAGELNPADSMTRAEAAPMIERILHPAVFMITQ